MKESAPTQTKEEATDSSYAGAVRAQATLWSFARTAWKKKTTILLKGYSERIALRREQCGISTKSLNSLIRRDVLLLDYGTINSDATMEYITSHNVTNGSTAWVWCSL
jgi:ribosome-binding protein aMBF1 (putative translation factor)